MVGGLLLLAAGMLGQAAPIRGPLTVSANPHYFRDGEEKVVILNGSHTWNTLQDWGRDGAVQRLDFARFVGFLTAHGHNFTLLWYTELPRFCGFPATAGAPPPVLTVAPHPWLRTGPGTATDGGPKFDLTRFDPAYFARLRSRVEALRKAGIYAGVYLFSGEWLNVFRCAGDGYPFTGANNINGVDDGYTGESKRGIGAVTMTAPNAITRFQDAYVEKAIDTLNDLPNVLWIVSEEAPPNSGWWNDHQIAHLRAYESGKPFQHPIGYAAPIGVPDRVVYDSEADWVAPAGKISPVRSCGGGHPACKVNVNDSDHSYFGLWHDTPRQNRNYEWENFTNGSQVLFMDPYVVYYPREKRNLCDSPVSGICRGPDARYNNLRDNLGYLLRYARKLDLAHAVPRPDLSSTGHCLASGGAGYLVYAPTGGPFTVDLSATPASRRLAGEWFDPSNGTTAAIPPVRGGGRRRFVPPFAGDAVLYLADRGR